MKTILNENVIFFDVDETLILHESSISIYVPYGSQIASVNTSEYMEIECPYLKKNVSFKKHEPHIKLLKEKKARGYYIVVWSAGGAAWAEEIVCALELSEYVDLIMTKPKVYVDDKNAAEWLTERVYIDALSKWKTS